MNKLRRFDRLLLAVSLLFSLAALVLVIQRVKIEQAQKTVCPVISYEDVTTLAQASGESMEEWYQTLSEAGLRGVLMTPKQMKKTERVQPVSDADLSVIQIGGLSKTAVYFPALHYDESTWTSKTKSVLTTVETKPIQEVVDSLIAQNSLLVLMEKEAQTGLTLPDGWDAAAYSGRIAKGYWLNRWCQKSVGRLGYAGTEETENILYRTVVDRGIQVLWIAPVSTEDGNMVTECAVYANLLTELEHRLNSAGYTYGMPEGYAPSEPSFLLLFFTGLAVLFACLLFVRALIPMPAKVELGLAALCVAENALALLLFRSLQITVLALAGSIVYPCLAAMLMETWMERSEPEKHRLRGMLVGGLLCVGVALLGGLEIAALQSSRAYLLVLRMFRGVKLSQSCVFGFAFLYFGYQCFHCPGNKLRDDRKALLKELRSPVLVGLVLAAMLGIGLVYLLRTGDRMLDVSVLEQRLRNVLERIVLYRPRTKEFLLGWPFLCMGLFFCFRRKRVLRWLCGVFAAIGFASIANTFCHSRAHVLVSLARTGIGLVLGLLLSAVLLAVICAVQRKKRKGSAQTTLREGES